MKAPTPSRVSGQEPRAYLWDYDGACAPGQTYPARRTFSVGIFQWLPKANGEGLRRSRVVERIYGTIHEANAVYASAKAECSRRNREENRKSLESAHG